MKVAAMGQVGPSILKDGTSQAFRQGSSGELMASALHGRYYEQTYRQNMFCVTDSSASRATTAGTSTTWTGFGVSNPFGSGVNLVFHKMFVATLGLLVTTVGAMYVLAGATSVTAGALPTNRFISGPTSKATTLVSASVISNTPTLINTYGFAGSQSNATYGLTGGVFFDFEGSVIIPPNYWLLSYTNVAVGGNMQFGYQWEEVPI